MQGAQKERHPRKKETTLKCKGLKRKTSDEKRDNPKMQGARKERPPMKKETTPKCNVLKKKYLRWKKRQP
jgi:hypothetical protein